MKKQNCLLSSHTDVSATNTDLHLGPCLFSHSGFKFLKAFGFFFACIFSWIFRLECFLEDLKTKQNKITNKLDHTHIYKVECVHCKK